MSDPVNERAGTSRRGRPSKISRDSILQAARTLPLETVTMQAVADVLHVDRKALSYHVSDVTGLRELVALDIFETELSRVEFPAGGDWREVVRQYARATRDAVVKVGPLATYIRLPSAEGTRNLVTVEVLLRSVVDAGFDVNEAGRILTLLTEVAYSTGRDTLRANHSSSVHPDVPDVARTLATASPSDFPMLRRLVEARQNEPSDDGQLEFDLTVILTGLERRLPDDSGR